MDTLIDTRDLRRIGRDEAFDLAAVEYGRYLEALRGLGAADWYVQTECPDWHVLDMARHVLGACEGCASPLQMAGQLRRGKRWAKDHGRPEIDGINALQVSDRQDLSPDEVVAALERRTPAAVRGRRRIPPRPPHRRRRRQRRPADVGLPHGGHLHA